jgi:uncharacterized alkaline shock family protein YloU
MTTDISATGDAFPNAFPFETENPSGVPGATKIEPNVLAAIVGHVADEIEGVARLGNAGGVLRVVADTVRSTASAKATGVDVEAGRKEAILDLEVVVLYGFRIPTVVQEIREATAKEIYNQIGLVAKEINVNVMGIEFPANAPRRGVE